LDEREREEFFRLKKIQEKKAQAIEKHKAEVGPEDIIETQQHISGQFAGGEWMRKETFSLLSPLLSSYSVLISL
jgi:hypothetical protein